MPSINFSPLSDTPVSDAAGMSDPFGAGRLGQAGLDGG